MRTATQETTSQITLKNRSKEARGKGQYICDFGDGRIHAIKYIFFKKIFTSLVIRLSFTSNTHHHERFQCFYRYEEI